MNAHRPFVRRAVAIADILLVSDVKPANDGSVLVSDDYSGTIYRLAPLAGHQAIHKTGHGFPDTDTGTDTS